MRQSRRLDWQMWFAALGRAERNLWFLNLIQKLLDDCGVVKNLVGDTMLLRGRPTKIRALLYHYDFTRLDKEWSRAVPGIKLANTTGLFHRPDTYWHRRLSRMYLRDLDEEERFAVESQLSSRGFTRDCQYGTATQCQSSANIWCHFTYFIRKYRLHLLPVVCLVSTLACRAVQSRNGRRFPLSTRKPEASLSKKTQ